MRYSFIWFVSAGEGSYSEEEEEEEEEEAMEGEGKDEVDMPDFAPFPHRPMIRSKNAVHLGVTS